MHKYIHTVFPQKNRDPDLPNTTNIPFASIYINMDNKTIISKNKFTNIPYVTPK